jgi:chaperonin GroES
MNLKLLDDRILVKPDEVRTKSAGGIILPGEDKKPPRSGTIVAMGTDEELNQTLKVGMRIFFPPFVNEELETDEGKFLLIKRDDVYAFFTM